jgi:hypothetical protein
MMVDVWKTMAYTNCEKHSWKGLIIRFFNRFDFHVPFSSSPKFIQDQCILSKTLLTDGTQSGQNRK